jgi:hypothetical protein
MSTNIHELMKPTGALDLCDDELMKGECVAVVTGGSAQLIERFVCEVAEFGGARVDWHYVGGRARVVAEKDNAAQVREAITALRLAVEIV